MNTQHSSILHLREHVRTPEQWSGALDAHPYIIDRTTDPLEQWTQFCMAYISDIAQSNTKMLPVALSDVFETINNIALYSFEPILIDDLDARAQQSVSRILSHIQNNNISCDATLAYEHTLYHCGNHERNFHLPPQWVQMQAHGLVPNPNNPISNHIWEKTFAWGCPPLASFLINNGVPPQWKGIHQIGTLGQKKYAADENVLSLVHDKRTFEVLKAIPSPYLQPLAQTVYKDGETPLHKAARHVLPEYVELLMSCGAVPVASAKGQYPLDVVRRTKSRTEGLEQLVALLGNATTKSPQDIFVQGIQSMDVSLMNLAHSKGADIHALSEDADVMKSLFENIPGGRLKKARLDQQKVITWLLDHDVSLVMSDQSTALHLAIKHGASPCVELLLGRRPELAHHVDGNGATPAQQLTVMVDKYPPQKTWLLREEEKLYMARTQMNMAKIYCNHNIVLQDTDFPSIAHDVGVRAAYEKMLLTQQVGAAGNNRSKRVKM